MKTRFVVIGLVISLLLTPALALAQAPPAVKLSVEAGLDGYYRVGQWLPVRAQLQNDGPAIDGRVEVVLPRPNGGEVTYRYPVNLPTQSHKEIALYVSPQEYISRLQIKLFDQAGQLIASQEQPLKAVDTNNRLYGILADRPSAFNGLHGDRSTGRQRDHCPAHSSRSARPVCGARRAGCADHFQRGYRRTQRRTARRPIGVGRQRRAFDRRRRCRLAEDQRRPRRSAAAATG